MRPYKLIALLNPHTLKRFNGFFKIWICYFIQFVSPASLRLWLCAAFPCYANVSIAWC